MAGTALYEDLVLALLSPDSIRIPYCLESAKIIPPPPESNPKHLWGHITAQGVARAEIQAPERKRVVCLAITNDSRDRGKPTSWSGEIDQLAAGPDGGLKRLFLISAGNVVDPDEWKSYPASNQTKEVEDPAQAWNALTVGAFTTKIQITDSSLRHYTPIAASGEISPFSSTSCAWPSTWPVKPEVVFEGGNVARDSSGNVFDPDDLALVSTYHKPTDSQFARFVATSAAVALGASFAARILVDYPSAWPETVRGLIVHSADWTSAMRKQFDVTGSKGSYRTLLRACGFGVPNLQHALSCRRNSLTLISQAELQPFDQREVGGYKTKDMHLYELPWPKDVLIQLGSVNVKMRITLSYFIEPGPGKIGWKDRYRYASHGLRFELNSPGEDRAAFEQRINKHTSDQDDGISHQLSGPSEKWTLGSQLRDVGSVHSDIWTGTAAELATSNFVAVRPTIGWWRERPHLKRWNSKCRYSLIITIQSPVENVDIYTIVSNQVLLAQPVSVII